ncbi:MAG: hypothetical protein ACP5VE_02235 [Chthonomonadales bacterium]
MLIRLLALCTIAAMAAGVPARAEQLPHFDFRLSEVVSEWRPAHDVASLEPTAQGMLIRISGPDPYIHGPARDYPPGQPLWLTIRFKSDQPGTGQVFWFTEQRYAREEDSVHFPAVGGRWETAKVPVPPLGPGVMLRLDPPGTGGTCIVASITFTPRNLLAEPAWPRPHLPVLGPRPLVIRSGNAQLLHAPHEWGGFQVRVSNRLMAVGDTRPLIGYLIAGGVHWMDVARAARVRASLVGRSIVVRAEAGDADGGKWHFTQEFSPAAGGTFNVTTRIGVTQSRAVVFAPMIILLPGAGSFGVHKGHALFAGLEYLDGVPSEVSSSTADIEGPLANRRVPDNERITFPLMAVQDHHAYVGLIWHKEPQFSALFDSPDRTFHGGGHLMGVIFPGSDGSNRAEGSLLPYDGEPVSPGHPITLRAQIIAGLGESVVEAVQHYVRLKGLPPIPSPGMGLQGYVRFAAGGWLDSRIRSGGYFRHAYWPGASFHPQPAADAALYMEWLAARTHDPGLAERLRQTERLALEAVSPADWDFSGVSHVHLPSVSLVFGHVEENAQHAAEAARAELRQLGDQGILRYQPKPGGPDFGRTHYEDTANGLTAPVTASLLEHAAISGEAQLIHEAVARLHALDRWMYTAPRGAQTWEVPLHTPDILASAHLVKAYTLGYALTGNADFLRKARYWAWTGVPFVYLVNPTAGRVGLYATTPVYGATHWVAPDWMGLPVQWCGLVYADALYRLTRYDPTGPWKKLADGITVSGIQQSFPASDADLQGLLPDSFNLKPQTRNGVAINPGTVEANAVRYYGGPPLYDLVELRRCGVVVRAPGAIEPLADRAHSAQFRVRGFTPGPYYVALSGLRGKAVVRVNGTPAAANQEHGRLAVRVSGSAVVTVSVR